MKTQFNKVKALTLKLKNESWKLDNMIDEKYGFSYSETDNDRIIDTLDYGTDDISFEDFKLIMEQYKKCFDENGTFR